MKDRIEQHVKGTGSTYTKKYNVTDILYFEKFENKKEAKAREKQFKNWHKEWKWNLIKETNPKFDTLKNY